MRLLRLLAALLVPVLLLPLLASPATAAARKTCRTSAGAERCAAIRSDDGPVFSGTITVTAERPRVRVRVLAAALQRRTAAGWTTVERTRSSTPVYAAGFTLEVSASCNTTERGVYRSRGKVQWKQVGEPGSRKAVVTSPGVRRSRLC